MSITSSEMMAEIMTVFDKNKKYASHLNIVEITDGPFNPYSNGVEEIYEEECENFRFLQKIIQELHEISFKYQSNLEVCTSIYHRFEHPHKSQVFANISQILEFHQMELNRQLLDCHGDIEMIGQMFYRNLKEGRFNCYLIYGMQRNRSRQVFREHEVFFQGLQTLHNISNSVQDYLAEPIEILTRYQGLLTRILDVLMTKKPSQTLSFQFLAVRNAIDMLRPFLTTFNESMNVGNIKEIVTNDCDGLKISLPAHGNSNGLSIDLLDQGNFLKSSTFEITEIASTIQYMGVLFLFEKCVIYTKQKTPEVLEYQGYFSTEQLKLNYSEGKRYFVLYNKVRGRQEIEFEEKPEILKEWVNVLKKVLKIPQEVCPPQKRHSIISNFGRFSFRRKSSISISSSRFYMEEAPKEINFNDMSFLSTLSDLEATYIDQLEELKKVTLDQKERAASEYYSALVAITALHRIKLTPVIQSQDVEAIFRVFEGQLKSQVFDIYDEYTEAAGKITRGLSRKEKILQLPVQQIKEYYKIFNGIDSCFSRLGLTDEYLHAKVAMVTEQMGKKCRRLEEIFKINCIKTILNFDMGSIVYSESVLIDKHPDSFRLFLMNNGVQCVRTLHAEEEIFQDIEFCCDYSHVKGRKSRLTNHLMYLKYLNLDGKVREQNIVFKNQSSRDGFYKSFKIAKLEN